MRTFSSVQPNGKRHWAQVVRRAPKASRTTSDGTTFDSLSEKARWHHLQFLEQTGAISDLRRQVKFPLVLPDGTPIKIRSSGYPNGRACSYRADFTYVDPWGRKITEEHKGRDDPTSRLRRAVVEAIYQIEITMTGPAVRSMRGVA